MKRELLSLVGGVVLAGGAFVPALADEASVPFSESEILSDAELENARGRFLSSSIVPELEKIVVLAATTYARGIHEALLTTAAGAVHEWTDHNNHDPGITFPELAATRYATGISEAIYTTAAGAATHGNPDFFNPDLFNPD